MSVYRRASPRGPAPWGSVGRAVRPGTEGMLWRGSRVVRPPLVLGGGSLPPPARWAPGVPLRPPGRRGWNRRLAAERGLIPGSEHRDCLSLRLAFSARGRGVGGRWSRMGWLSPAWGSQCLATAGTELAAADRDPPQLAGLKCHPGAGRASVGEGKGQGAAPGAAVAVF